MKLQKINLLVTLDENYIPYMNVMLTSLLHSNKDCYFDVYLLRKEQEYEDVFQFIEKRKNCWFCPIRTLSAVCTETRF